MMEGRITICRTMSNVGPARIRITIKDTLSSVEFVELTMSMEDFAMAVTGMGSSVCDIEVRGLDVVGKKMEMDKLEFEIPKVRPYESRRDIAVELAKEKCPVGWHPDEGYSSQGSFFTKDGKPYARTTIRRWVDVK